MSQNEIKKSMFVVLTYEIYEESEILEQVENPVTLIHGQGKKLLPKIEEALLGKKAGDIVEAGQVIGLGGSSGRSSGSHLHFEVRYKGKPLNPKHLINFRTNELVSDSLLLTKKKCNYAVLPLGIEFHTIKRGDFMFKIDNRYGLTINELCKINGISRNKVLYPGRKLRIK